MRKFLSLIFALFVTLPFCTKCYAIEVDSLGDEVRHVVRQSVPANRFLMAVFNLEQLAILNTWIKKLCS